MLTLTLKDLDLSRSLSTVSFYISFYLLGVFSQICSFLAFKMPHVGFQSIVLMISITFNKVISGGFRTALKFKFLFCVRKSKELK